MFAASAMCFMLKSAQVRRPISTGLRKRLAGASISPPRAKKIEEIMYFGINPKDKHEIRGDKPMNPPKTRVDYYNWLRDNSRKDEDVLSHIHAENAYCADQMEPLQSLQNELYEEMLSHLKETDEDVPYPSGQHLYYTRTQKGLSYKIHCRKPLTGGPEEVILDENLLAASHEYSVLDACEPSPDHSLLAYSVDQTGYETYSVRVKNLATGEILQDEVEGSDAHIEWGADQSTLFYLTVDEEHRPNKVFLHILGTLQSEDVCIFQEDDSRFWVGITKTASGRFLIIDSSSKETSEVHVVDLLNLNGGEAHRVAGQQRLQCISHRKEGIRYEIEHLSASLTEKDSFAIISNIDNAKNFKLLRSEIDAIGDSSTWIEVKPYDPTIQIQSILPFQHHVVIYGRQDGRENIWIASIADLSRWTQVPFDEDCYSVWVGDNYQFNNPCVRLVYSSFVTPRTVFNLNLQTMEKVILKVQEVPGYEASRYESKRIMINARDNVQIPCSMVFCKSSSPFVAEAQPRPTLLYGYGSYGHSVDPTFDYKRISLLDRGVVFAIAHIRGGGEMGRSWYEDHGKYLTKRNTFNDFADCAAHLSKVGITAPDRLAIVGRSAGGLLVGAVTNEYPHLMKAVVADVPFVDVVNTMSDPTIPLTVTEWLEWGNPNEEKYFSYMASYSPYDNVKAQDYPAMMVTGGLNDPRVPYWEPVKWVAKLRELKTDQNKVLLKVDMSSGHFSASDRYKYLKETAHEYAFILDQIGGV